MLWRHSLVDYNLKSKLKRYNIPKFPITYFIYLITYLNFETLLHMTKKLVISRERENRHLVSTFYFVNRHKDNYSVDLTYINVYVKTVTFLNSIRFNHWTSKDQTVWNWLTDFSKPCDWIKQFAYTNNMKVKQNGQKRSYLVLA